MYRVTMLKYCWKISSADQWKEAWIWWSAQRPSSARMRDRPPWGCPLGNSEGPPMSCWLPSLTGSRAYSPDVSWPVECRQMWWGCVKVSGVQHGAVDVCAEMLKLLTYYKNLWWQNHHLLSWIHCLGIMNHSVVWEYTYIGKQGL